MRVESMARYEHFDATLPSRQERIMIWMTSWSRRRIWKPRLSRIGFLTGFALFLMGVPLAVPNVVHAQDGVGQLTINQIWQEPDRDDQVCRIEAYLTVTDASGTPVEDLDASDFEVEDSTRGEVALVPEIELSGVDRAGHVVLAIDVSGSMQRPAKIQAARDAATGFVEALNESSGDRDDADTMAVYSFEGRSRLLVDWLEVGDAALVEAIQSVEAVPDAPTCLFDMAYEAVEKAAEKPGRGSVVLFTDGVDERPVAGQDESTWPNCSTVRLEDVVDRARETGVALHTIGLEARPSRAEQQRRDLNRLASQAGGRTWLAPAESDLGAAFASIASQLSQQYVVRYRLSTAATADRTLKVQSRAAGGILEDRRVYKPCVPGPKAVLDLVGGSEGTSTVRASVKSLNGIQRVIFEVDDEVIQERLAPPFEAELPFDASEAMQHRICARVRDQLDVEGQDCYQTDAGAADASDDEVEIGVEVSKSSDDPQQMSAEIEIDSSEVDRISWSIDGEEQADEPWDGSATITWTTAGAAGAEQALEVIAYDDAGAEIGRARRSVEVSAASETTDTEEDSGGGGSTLLLVMVAAVAGLLYWRRRKKQKGASDDVDDPFLFDEPSEPSGGSAASGSTGPSAGGRAPVDIDAMRTRDVSALDREPAQPGPARSSGARLRVQQSDELRPGTTFDLPAGNVRIGRGSRSDIVVPDSPVSRSHAELIFDGRTFQIRDLGSSYGTSVNGVATSGAGTPLHHGDLIQLGTRSALIFEQPDVASRNRPDEDVKRTQVLGGKDNIAETQFIDRGRED